MPETKEKPNTDAIHRAYLAYRDYKGIQPTTLEDALATMATDLQALREEYGV